MDADFAAAHSMDTEWFAVDARGQVAIFSTGENGHVPDLSQSHPDRLWELWSLFHPGAEADADQLDGLCDDPAKTAADLGVFYYNYGEEFDPIGTYWRESVPAHPLHIDQLPPNWREICRSVCYDKLNFAETPVIQPLEWEDCNYWYTEARIAYLASDETTIRPIPGEESRFADFCEQFRRENPEAAAKFRFEGPADVPKMGDG